MYILVIYVEGRYGPRAEEGQHGAAHPLPARGAPAPRLRHRPADRAAQPGGGAAARRLPLSPALSPGEAGLGGGPVGGEGGRAAPPLLPPHRPRPRRARGPAGHLARLRGPVDPGGGTPPSGMAVGGPRAAAPPPAPAP